MGLLPPRPPLAARPRPNTHTYTLRTRSCMPLSAACCGVCSTLARRPQLLHGAMVDEVARGGAASEVLQFDAAVALELPTAAGSAYMLPAELTRYLASEGVQWAGTLSERARHDDDLAGLEQQGGPAPRERRASFSFKRSDTLLLGGVALTGADSRWNSWWHSKRSTIARALYAFACRRRRLSCVLTHLVGVLVLAPLLVFGASAIFALLLWSVECDFGQGQMSSDGNATADASDGIALVAAQALSADACSYYNWFHLVSSQLLGVSLARFREEGLASPRGVRGQLLVLLAATWSLALVASVGIGIIAYTVVACGAAGSEHATLPRLLCGWGLAQEADDGGVSRDAFAALVRTSSIGATSKQTEWLYESLTALRRSQQRGTGTTGSSTGTSGIMDGGAACAKLVDVIDDIVRARLQSERAQWTAEQAKASGEGSGGGGAAGWGSPPQHEQHIHAAVDAAFRGAMPEMAAAIAAAARQRPHKLRPTPSAAAEPSEMLQEAAAGFDDARGGDCGAPDTAPRAVVQKSRPSRPRRIGAAGPSKAASSSEAAMGPAGVDPSSSPPPPPRTIESSTAAPELNDAYQMSC